MSFVKIWIHAVWSTKYREQYLIPSIRPLVFKHIKEFSDHAHALISLGKNQNLANIMQSIKGESSHWINENRIIHRHFLWQDDYFAVSVSPSQVQYVRNYIRNQEKHHSIISWDAEIRSFMDNYGFERMKDLG